MKNRRKAGVLLHPTSLPGPFGIGDFGSAAYEFVDFLSNSNQKLWQILPLNPVDFANSPYHSCSSFAGNTMLISPQMLVKYGLLTEYDISNPPDFDAAYVDYPKVKEYKEHLYKIAFKNFKQNADNILVKEFEIFLKASPWLENYALYTSFKEHLCLKRLEYFDKEEYNNYTKKYTSYFTSEKLNSHYKTGVLFTWPDKLFNRDEKVMAEYMALLSTQIEYHEFLQFIFYKQWQQLKAYANSRNVEIVGDMPIFISADSADFWENGKMFLTDSIGFPSYIAGVPPDYFSETGQLWGNPIYDFEFQSKDNYSWWVNRFRHYFNIYDIVRIDHFRGFSEFWQVPYGEKTAINGQWIKGPGKDLFDSVEAALGRLPVIAEDLGIITEDVIALRKSLAFPGMKILQFAFISDNENAYLPHNFEDTNYVVYTGTHDNNTTLGWYENALEEEKDAVRRYLSVSGDDISWDLIRLAYSTTADTVIIPLQDLMNLGAECRMNTPGVTDGNWQFRFVSGSLSEGISKGLKLFCKLYNR